LLANPTFELQILTATIYEIDEAVGQNFIAMELLKGKTLRHRIAGKPMEIEAVLDLDPDCRRVRRYSRSFVHRGLNPENIFVTRDGRLKILDFGLAKLVSQEGVLAADAATLASQTEPTAPVIKRED
jgi:eukaryotic-like serine/threonine-protein kinase